MYEMWRQPQILPMSLSSISNRKQKGWGKKMKIPEDKIKCINCGQNHTSCFVDCTVRIEYIESRKRQQQHHQRINKSFVTPKSGCLNMIFKHLCFAVFYRKQRIMLRV